MKPCLDCGEPSDQTRCPDHQLKDTRDRRARGYDWQWDQLSRRARRLQKFCTDCGTTDNLQCDHLPSAWARKAQGKPVRLADVDVVCNVCNVKRGSARPGSRRATQGTRPEPTGPSTDGKAQRALHTRGDLCI